MIACKLPGCEKLARQGSYCSQEHKFIGRQQSKERNHDRAMFEAARNATPAAPCIGCPGGFYATDEAQMTRCGCGRNFEVAA